MKKIITIILLSVITLPMFAQQKLDDVGRIIINSYLPENTTLPNEARNQLMTKLNQVTTNNGMGGSQVNGRFIITAQVVVGSKDIISGPPQMIAQNIDISFFVGDAVNNIIYANTTLSTRGVGLNENKAMIDAFKSINPKSKDLIVLLETSKNKIIEYYSTNCDYLIKNAEALTSQKKYNEAIYELASVPDVCKDCYFKCLDNISLIFQKNIDEDCKLKLTNAKSTWMSTQNSVAAEKVGNILSTINPFSSCQEEINEFIKKIDSKLRADENKQWHFKLKQYNDNNEMERIRMNNYREIALEYARSQPKKIVYNSIIWK